MGATTYRRHGAFLRRMLFEGKPLIALRSEIGDSLFEKAISCLFYLEVVRMSLISVACILIGPMLVTETIVRRCKRKEKTSSNLTLETPHTPARKDTPCEIIETQERYRRTADKRGRKYKNEKKKGSGGDLRRLRGKHAWRCLVFSSLCLPPSPWRSLFTSRNPQFSISGLRTALKVAEASFFSFFFILSRVYFLDSPYSLIPSFYLFFSSRSPFLHFLLQHISPCRGSFPLARAHSDCPFLFRLRS